MGMDEEDQSKSKNVPAYANPSHGRAPMHTDARSLYSQLHAQLHGRNRVANRALPLAQNMMNPSRRHAFQKMMLTKYNSLRKQNEIRTRTSWGGEKDHTIMRKFDFEAGGSRANTKKTKSNSGSNSSSWCG